MIESHHRYTRTELSQYSKHVGRARKWGPNQALEVILQLAFFQPARVLSATARQSPRVFSYCRTTSLRTHTFGTLAKQLELGF